MAKFIYKSLLFFLLISSILVVSLFGIKDYTARESVLAAVNDKHQAINAMHSPKTILIGGSNLSFGMDSEKIVEEFNMPVYNMAIHAGLGLRYMMKESEPYINNGDLVILIPEYSNFYSDHYFGNIELVATVFDVHREGLKYISLEQWNHLGLMIFKYAARKLVKYPFTILDYYLNDGIDRGFGIYERYSFNQYGDAYRHWDKPNESFLPFSPVNGREKIINSSINELQEFKDIVLGRGAQLLIMPPVLQRRSYNNLKPIITKIESTLAEYDIAFCCPVEKYVFEDELFLNTPYHLNKKGIDKRTTLVIDDIDSYFLNNMK